MRPSVASRGSVRGKDRLSEQFGDGDYEEWKPWGGFMIC